MLGQTNLLIILQPVFDKISKINFHELHAKLQTLNLKFAAQILIAHNENNQENIIHEVHPELGKCKIPVRYLSIQLEQS